MMYRPLSLDRLFEGPALSDLCCGSQKLAQTGLKR